MESSNHFKNGANPKSQMSREINFKEMKRIIFIATIISALALMTAFTTTNSNSAKTEMSIESSYCDGWEDGYCEGWKDIKSNLALCPLTPLCPLPELFKDRYRDGYHRGFRAGARAALK